ncbi:hypothetical protein Taro_003330 [Colocasia esculenta]|uniref:Uncharacterized protein n=1 Tax=Colocasia esculenta TaxID=4460 RepID=A0A843TLB5_COLES|nr:hypothetical protein [Colocasia esculenta]
MSNKRHIFTILHVSVLCQAPRVHTPAVNKYVGVLLPRTGQGPYCTGIGSSFGPESHVVPNKKVHIMATEFQQQGRSSVDTRSSGVDTMLPTQDKIMQNWSGSVDTRSSSVDTRDSFQKTFWPIWDSVSTLAQVVSTLDQFSRKPSGSTGTVCRHWLK